MNVSKWWIQYLKWPIFIRISVIVFIIIITFGFIIYYIEPNQFSSPFEGIWWALVTISTVGYGDFVPETVKGRLLGMVLIVIGASFITAYFASLSAATVKKQNSLLEGLTPFNGSHHFIIVGWSQKANELIKMLRFHRPFHSIVLIDSTLKQAPYLEEKIHFIKGNPLDDNILKKANIQNAQTVFILSDQHKNELNADMKTILILLAVKGMNPSVYTICEILTEMQSNNAKRAGADDIIHSYKITSQVMLSSCIAQHGFSRIFDELSPANGTYIKSLAIEEEQVGATFQMVHDQLFLKHKILLGIKRGEDIIMNPPQDFKLTKEDNLIIITG